MEEYNFLFSYFLMLKLPMTHYQHSIERNTQVVMAIVTCFRAVRSVAVLYGDCQ